MSVSDTPARSLARSVQAGTGLDADAAAAAVQAVVSALIEALPAADRGVLRALLPEPGERHRPAALADETLDAFYARVADRLRAPMAQALELAQVVCRAVGEHLDEDAHRHVVSRLPDALGALLAVGPASVPPPDRPARVRQSDHTLATGKPGSHQPVAEAAPHGAHAHSVAASDNPHGDTKLSSSPGATQEREGETLATGQPGSGRPLDES